MRRKILCVGVALMGLLLTPLDAEAKVLKYFHCASSDAASAPATPTPSGSPAASESTASCNVLKVARSGPLCAVTVAVNHLKTNVKISASAACMPAACQKETVKRCPRRCQHRR